MIVCFFLFIGYIVELYSSCNINDTCQTPLIRNGIYYTVNNLTLPVIIFRCNKNYKLLGRDKNRCLCQRWLYPFPICQPQFKVESECLAPFIKKGWVECLTIGCNKFYVGTEAAIRCERGYQLQGSGRLHCQLTNEPSWNKAKWSSPVPKCVQIDNESPKIHQITPSSSIFYTENSTIMVIIIILSILACGLMLLISAMLMNRLVKRRRAMRLQRSANEFLNHCRPQMIDDVDRIETQPAQPATSIQEAHRWNCFSRGGTSYQQIETQPTESNTIVEQTFTPADTPELYSRPIICSDDRESLINPPCYEEAIKCSQYSIVVSSLSSDAFNSKSNKKSKHDTSKSSKREKKKAPPIRSTVASVSGEFSNENYSESSIPNTSAQSNDISSQNIVDNSNSVTSNAGPRSSDVDNVSRSSARVHYGRIVNNISAESNNSFLSGSIETMAISDGTSVTVHTFDSMGSNPSIGSMRPQTGSIGDPTNCPSIRPRPSRYMNRVLRSNESDFTDIESTSRYSPPPSYEKTMCNQMILKTGRACRSNTASPSNGSGVALFVDNMACGNDTGNIPS